MLYFKRSWKMVLTAGFAVLIAGLTLTPIATARTWSEGGSSPSSNNPNAYYLLGDTSNYGSSSTRIYTTQTNGDGLYTYCYYGSACYGLWGSAGSGIGTVGTGVWGTYGGGSQYGVYATSPHGYANNLVCDYTDCWASVSNWREWVGQSITAYNFYYHSVAGDGTMRSVPMAASTESRISDEGTAQLVNGRAVIQFDSLYADTVNLSSQYQVFVTPNSADTAGLAVINKTATSFEVRELAKGTGNFSFDWRIDGLRKGEEGKRMEVITDAPEQLSNMPTGLGPSTADQQMLDKINKGAGTVPPANNK